MKLKIQIVLAGIFTFLGIIANIFNLVNSDESLMPFFFLALYFFTVLYLVYDYKTPHGNLLKTAVLAFAFSIIILFDIENSYSIITKSCLGISAVLAGYTAGRLNKLEKNRFNVIIVSVCLFIAATSNFIDSGMFNGNWMQSIALYNYLIIWFVLLIVYFARFKAHIEAGKEE